MCRPIHLHLQDHLFKSKTNVCVYEVIQLNSLIAKSGLLFVAQVVTINPKHEVEMKTTYLFHTGQALCRHGGWEGGGGCKYHSIQLDMYRAELSHVR